MSEPPECVREVAEWLLTLRLSQYAPSFLGAGYRTLGDCRGLTEERLLELDILPTGHRRRMLRSLEALGVTWPSGGETEDERGAGGDRKPVPQPRHIFLGVKRGQSYQHRQLKERRDPEGSRTLPPGSGLVPTDDHQAGRVRPPQPAPRKPENIQPFPYEPAPIPPSVSSCSSSSSSSESLSFSGMPSDWDLSPEEPGPQSGSDSTHVSSEAQDRGGFTGEMVENCIYEAQPALAGVRLTRSYRLRHRPVPDIPSLTPPPLRERSAQHPV